jgi:cell wall-associated NlpC family hydrolase
MNRGSQSLLLKIFHNNRFFYVATLLILFVGVGATYRSVSNEYTVDMDFDMLSSGDLIFVRGSTIRGTIVRFFEKSNQYSHVGIVVKNDNSIQVIHASPGENAEHVIRKVSLAEFVADEKITDFAIYRVSEDHQLLQKATSYAEECARNKVPFDDAFSMKSEDSLYCTELVWRAYIQCNINLCSHGFSSVASLFIHEPIILPSNILSWEKLRCVIKIHK